MAISVERLRHIANFDTPADPRKALHDAADQIEGLTAALRAAIGYMMNADIDLATGTKRRARQTLHDGIKVIEKALK